MPDGTQIPPLPKGYEPIDTSVPPLPKGYFDLKKKVGSSDNGIDASAPSNPFLNAQKPTGTISQKQIEESRNGISASKNKNTEQKIAAGTPLEREMISDKGAFDRDEINKAAINTAERYFKNNPKLIYNINSLKKKNEFSLKNATTQEDDLYSLKSLKNTTPFQRKVAEIKQAYENGDLALTHFQSGEKAQGERPEPVFTKSAKFLRGIGQGVELGLNDTKDAIVNMSSNDKEFADYLDKKGREIPEVPEEAPSGIGGKIGTQLGSLIKPVAEFSLGTAATSEIGGFGGLAALAADVIPSSTTAKTKQIYYENINKLREKYGDDIPEEERINAMKDARSNATLQAVPEEAMQMYLFGRGAGALGNIQRGGLNAFKNSLLKAGVDIPKMGALGGAEEAAALGIAKLQGYDTPDAAKKIGQAVEDWATVEAAFKIAHGIISAHKYLRSSAKEVVSELPIEIGDKLSDEAIAKGWVTQEQADKSKTDLQQYKKIRETLPDDLPPEKAAAVTGLLQRNENLEKQKQTNNKILHDDIDAEIDNNTAKAKQILNSSNPLKYETDDLTGERGVDVGGRPSVTNPKEFGEQKEENGVTVIEPTVRPNESVDVQMPDQINKPEITTIGNEKETEKPILSSDEGGNTNDGLVSTNESGTTKETVRKNVQPQQEEVEQTALHTQNIKDKFRQVFKEKGNSDEQIDGAIALMDARAKSWASEEKGRSPEQWYSGIADIKNGEFEANTDKKFQVDAWHGSPHDFDKFSLRNIGSGEGVQAFGHGLYFTDLKDIAMGYAKKLAKDANITIDGYNIKNITPSRTVDLLQHALFENGFDIKKAKEAVRSESFYGKERDSILKYLDKTKVDLPRNLYQVTLHEGKKPSDYNWLDWDKKPDKKQSEKLLNKLTRDQVDKGFYYGIKPDATNADLYKGLSKALGGDIKASEFLLKNGIDGVKYPAESISRGTTSENARGFNYVVFDDKAVSIKNKIKFQGEKGAVETLKDGRVVIHALNAPDFSTMVHEIAHVFEGDLTQAEQKTVKDFGGSEVFARGFERYLRDGKAPTIELKSLFEKFKTWLTNIYQSLKGSPIEKKVSPEIKQIFDRLLTEKEKNNSSQLNTEQDALSIEKTNEMDVGEQAQNGSGMAGGNAKPESATGKEEKKQTVNPEKENTLLNEGAIYTETPKTVLTHRGLQEIATETGLEDITPREKQTRLQQLKDADNTISEWKDKGTYTKNINDVIDRAKKGQINEVEQKVLANHIATLRENLRNIGKEKGITSQEFKDKVNELSDVVEAGRMMRSSAGGLLGDKAIGVPDDTLEGFLMQEKELNKGAELTDNQITTAVNEHAKIEAANNEFKEKYEKLQADYAKLLAEREVKKRASSTSKNTKKTHEDFVKERKAYLDEFKEAKKKHEEFLKEKGIQKQGFGNLTLTPEMAKAIGKMIGSYIEEGISKLDDVVSKITEDLKEFNISDREVRNVIAGAYNEPKKTRNHVAEQRMNLKIQQQLIDKYEAMLKGEKPKDEKKLIRFNQEIHDLRQKIKGLEKEEKEANTFYGESDAGNRRIEKLEDELQRLRERRPKADTPKERRELSSKEKELKSQILEERKKIKAEEKEANTRYREEIDERVKKLQQLKERNRKELEKIEEEFRTGNFKVPEKKVPLTQNEELKKAFPKAYKEALESQTLLIKARQARQLRMALREFQAMSERERALKQTVRYLNVPRTLMASMDFSAPLRQGVLATIAHPSIAKQAFGKMFGHTFNQAEFDRFYHDLQDSPRYEVYKESGLALTDPHSLHLDKQEEAYLGGNIAEKIPIIGGGVKASERAYVSYLNKLRMDLFDRFAERFEADGKTINNSPELYKQLASFVNTSTGRGGMGKMERIAPELSTVLFAPRLIASRLNMLGIGDIFEWGTRALTLNKVKLGIGYYTKLPKELRVAAVVDMLKLIGTGITFLAAAKYGLGADVEIDPRSSDFGKIKIGNTRWDIWGGLQPYVRLFAQLAAGSTKSANSGKVYELGDSKPFGRTRTDVIGTSVRGKLAPVPSAVWDLISGRTAIGEKIDRRFDIPFMEDKNDAAEGEKTLTTFIGEHFIPLLFQDVKDAMKEQGVKGLFTVGVPSVFGVGVNTYEPRVQKSKGITTPKLPKPPKIKMPTP